MKKLLLALICAASLQAQTAQPTHIVGGLVIKFDTRTSAKLNEGVTDKYVIDVNVSNSALFRGSIDHLPTIPSTFGVSQQGGLTYAVELDVVNPANISQTRNVGRLYGGVPIDVNNVYSYSAGSAKAGVFGIGSAKGFESKFYGLALGKPPVKTGIFDRVKQESLSIARSVQGKTAAIQVTKYDKMEFQNVVVPAGPVAVYPEVTISGQMIYDYARSAWHLNQLTASYVSDSKRMQDSITGSIRWVEKPNRKVTGEGEYIFDVRVNEPIASENAVFAQVADESAFFAEDNTVPSLTGTMKYKDAISGDRVISSVVKIDLTGSKLTKQQTMYLFKLLFLTAVVPFNSE